MAHLSPNWFDIIIILAIAVFVWRGIKEGFITQVLTTIGFFGAMFLGGWIFPHLLRIHDRTLLTVVNGNMVLIFAVILGFFGYTYGRKIDFAMGKSLPHFAATYIGVVYSIAIGLIAVWLITSLIGRLPFEGLSNSANDSLIVQLLDDHLPPIPAVFAEFNKQIDPNIPPQTFVKNFFQTQYEQTPLSPALSDATMVAQLSVVRISGFGCGGIVTGSGIVVAPNLVLTNAHVLAGVKRPIIKYGRQSYTGTPVLFDPNLDIAILQTKLNVMPLKFDPGIVSSGTPVAILGYPNGNFTVTPAQIVDQAELQTPNLYDEGTVNRAVYELSGIIGPGSSGGPMLLTNGEVGGVIFAKPNSSGNYAYVLTSQSVIPKIKQAVQTNRKVSTGACYSD